MLALLSTLKANLLAAGAVVLAVLGAVFFIRRDAAKDERARITAETQRRRLEDIGVAREVEHRTAGLDDDEVRRRVRELAARRNGHG